MGKPVQQGPGGAGTHAAEFLDAVISRPDSETVLLTVRGEVDTLTAPTFTAGIDELLEAKGDILIIDMTGVRFLASSGLAVLIAAAQRAKERGTRLRLVVATRAVLRPIEITGTDGLFDLHPDLESATMSRD